MKRNVFLQSTFRQPLRTTFLILLLGLISFAFISKATEYLVVQRETGRLGGYYRSIGTLQRTDPGATDIFLGAELVKRSPYLGFEDRLRVCSGIMDGTYNADIYGTSAAYSNGSGYLLKGLNDTDFWFYGDLSSKKEITKNSDQEKIEIVGYDLTFKIDKVVAAYPESIKEGRSTDILFIFKGNEESISLIEAMEVGQRYFIRGWFDFGFNLDPGWQNASSVLKLRPLNDMLLWFLPVTEGAELNLNDPALTSIKNEIEILKENQHALKVTGTADMSAMPQAQQSSRVYYLIAGRWLNRMDDQEVRKVIVIPGGLAEIRGFKLGDKITLKLRGLKDPFVNEYIMTDKDRENWRSYSTYEETFEIVGIYGRTYGINGTEKDNHVYIPKSTLPEGYENHYDGLNDYMYSFVLDSSRHQEAFVNENKEKLASLGISLSFVENNGQSFWAGVDPIRHSATAGVWIFSMVLLLSLLLAVFLYQLQRRRDYAILRALGVPKKQANFQLLLPLTQLSIIGILAGSIPSWKYALNNAATSLSTLPTPAGEMPSPNLNPIILIALCTMIFFLLMVFAWIGLRLIVGKPVLELLQGTFMQTGGKRKPKKSLPKASLVLAVDSNEVAYSMQRHPLAGEKALTSSSTGLANLHPQAVVHRLVSRRRRGGALVRYALRHTLRSSLKSLLTIAIASGFVCGLGWMQWTMDKNRIEVDRLYNTTVVDVDIMQNNLITTSGELGFIDRKVVDAMMQSGFIQYAYLEAVASRAKIGGIDGSHKSSNMYFEICAFNQPEKYFSTLLTQDALKFASGWDENMFTKTWTREAVEEQGVPAVFPESILKKFSLHLGDKLFLVNKSGQSYDYIVAGQYAAGMRQISKYILQSAVEQILVPLSALDAMEGRMLRYEVAKFELDPTKNRELPAFRAQMEAMIDGPDASRSPLRIIFWDEELRAVVAPMEKNLSLLAVLYPVTIIISVLIGLGLCLLMVLQSAKEAAILRVLGVTKARMRGMYSIELLLLSLIGIIMGLGILALLRKDMGVVLTGSTLIAAGFYLVGVAFGSLLGAISVTRHKPMEQLQVKE